MNYSQIKKELVFSKSIFKKINADYTKAAFGEYTATIERLESGSYCISMYHFYRKIIQGFCGSSKQAKENILNELINRFQFQIKWHQQTSARRFSYLQDDPIILQEKLKLFNSNLHELYQQKELLNEL